MTEKPKENRSHLTIASNCLQTTSNACASIALLNLLMNVPDLELGPTLESLKRFTETMSPALRGYQVGNSDFIRGIHNSYTRWAGFCTLHTGTFKLMLELKGRWTC
jgi:hypothetical protein